MDDGFNLLPQVSGTGSDGTGSQQAKPPREPESTAPEEKRTGDGCFARLANNERFQHITLGVIVLNALWIFVDVQWNHSALRGEDGRLPLEPYSIAVENAFCTYFTLEVICRFLAFRKFRYCFIDAWFVFDLTLVIFMVLETWVLALIELASGGFNAGGGVLSNLSSFRLLRLLRLTRVARLMRFFPELLTLVKGMVRAMQSVGFILLFMVVVTYVFAIVFTSQLGEWDYVPPADAEDPTAKELFGDMGSSMMTLFTNGVLVDDLTFTLTEIRKEILALMWAFMVFIIISGMTLLNMLIGVLCQVIEDSSREEAEARQLHELKMCLVEAFQATDESQDGLINEEEWAKIATNKKVQAALLKLGVEDSMMEERLKQMQESLFGRRNGTEAAEAEAAEEPERQDGLSFEEFVDQVADLRMDTPASAMEVEMLMSDLATEHKTLRRRLAYMEAELRKIAGIREETCVRAPVEERQRIDGLVSSFSAPSPYRSQGDEHGAETPQAEAGSHRGLTNRKSNLKRQEQTLMARLAVSFAAILLWAAASNAANAPDISKGHVTVGANQTGAKKPGTNDRSLLNVKRMGGAASNATNATNAPNATNATNASNTLNGGEVTVGANETAAKKPGSQDRSLLNVKRMGKVTILHVSDTHGLHWQVGNLPNADIFIHSGDVGQSGSDGEFGDFNNWLGSIKGKFKHMFLIAGNHDFWNTNWRLNQGWLSPGAAWDPNYFQYKFTNAQVLKHEMVQVMGLNIWGDGWKPQRGDSDPGNNYQDLPWGIDVLVTHEAPYGIFDQTGGGNWGSSHDLLAAIWEKKPKVHLFGHIHEQRGHWDKTASGWYAGGSEYRPNLWNPQVFKPNVPPPQNYPVEVESNNAMANQPLVDNSWGAGMSAQHLVGRPRLITGQLCTDGWHFSSWIP
ncbi:unnamed protein product [Effrenium voratum]|uniref:EF-hand domain-containing protein n=1 Tax=Effrenium voratum TaxID=2562239 RepID=A0AA36N3W4_9DINO|nr:unnamed protein product [Effrenium voratum]